MAGLQVVSSPNQPTLAPTVAPAPTGVPTGPLSVVNRPAAPQPAKIPVVSQPAGVQPSLSVQPLPQQPSIYVPPKPPEPPQMDKIASDIGVARGRGADDTTILYSLVKKNPVLTQDVKVAIQERKATPTQVLDAIVAKHTPQPEQPGFFQSVAQGIAKTPIQVGKGVVGLIDLIGSKLTSDPSRKAMLEQRGADVITKPTDAGYFGQVEPAKYTTAEAIGKGLELGSYAIGGGGAKKVGSAVVKQGLKQAAIQGTKAGLEVGLVSGLGRGLQEDNPTVGTVAKDTLTDTAIGGLFGLVTGVAGYGLKTGIQKTISALSPKYQAQNLANRFEQTVQDGFSKGVKPSVNSGADKKAVEAVATIIDNKASIQLPDESGNLVARLPKNNQEFAEAIGQTKKNIFQRYNFFNRAAGSTGAQIELSPVADKIEQVINTPEIRDVRPDVFNYGKKIAETLRQRGVYSLEDSQDVIAALNSDAQGFFKTLNQNDKPKGALAASIAETLRSVQAKTINSLTGAGQDWSLLRKQYGSLEAVEKDVTHRALIQARRGPVSVFDLFQAANAGDVARVLVGDFSGAAKGVISGTVTKILKNANDPDRIVAKMFKEAAKYGEELSKINGSVLPKVRPAIPRQLALPAPKADSPKASVNVPIYQPSRVVTNEAQTVQRRLTNPRLPAPSGGPYGDFTKGQPLKFGAIMKRVNDALNEVTPGLSVKDARVQNLQTEWQRLQQAKLKTTDKTAIARYEKAQKAIEDRVSKLGKNALKLLGITATGYAAKEGSQH